MPASVLGAVAAVMGVSGLASQAGQRLVQGIGHRIERRISLHGGGCQEGAAGLSGSEL